MDRDGIVGSVGVVECLAEGHTGSSKAVVIS
jgi:hypothetical protein